MTRFPKLVAAPTLRLFAMGALTAVSAISIACSSSPQEKEAKFLRNGQALLEKKDYSRALLQFKNAAVAMPKDAEPYYRIGVASLAAGSLPNAIQALRKATELNPKHEQAQLKLAQLMTESANKEVLQQAAGKLAGVLSASPENPDASDALAFAEWKLGKTDEAEGRLQETLQKFPARLQTSVELARLKLGQKDLGAAEQVLKQAVASDPQSAAAELALGQLYMLANQPAKAEPELRKAIQLEPKKGAALMALGAIQAASNRMDEAEQTYRQASTVPGAEFKPVHALFLYKTGKRDAALAEFERLAKEDPNDRNARGRLVAIYAAMGKTQAAQSLLAAALKKNPKDTDALFQRAELLMRAGNAADAEKDLKEVLRFKPDFAEAHVAMAQIYKTQKLAREERQEYDQALRLNPRLLSARLALAQSYTASREAKSALDVLDHTPAQQKQTLGVVIERNWALLAAGETKELRSSLDQILRIRRYPELVLQDGVLRFEQGDYSGARADAEEAIKNNPADLRGVQILVDSYAAQKQPAKAEERLKSIAAASPQSAPLANMLGQWYANAKNFPAARKAFESALGADPKFQPAVLALAGIDHLEKHPDAARQRLLGLVSADPNNTQALLMLGVIAGEMGDQEEAMKRYRAALAVDSNNVGALNNLAYTLASTDTDGALKYAQQAAELAPDNATVQDTLGWVYYRKQIYSTAVTYLKTAVAKEPTPRREFHLAMSYLKAGNQELGQKTLQLALQQDPKLPVTEKGW